MIVKNEAAFLQGCLSSLRDHTNEIVIVDTGSVDATPQIATSFGCTVLHFPWRDDFAAARNFALENASNDWILYIDADERLVCPSGSHLPNLLPSGEVSGLRLKFRPRSDMTCYDELRLFRRDERIRFSGIIHETIVPAVKVVCEEDGTEIIRNYDIGIEHLGYDGVQDHKHERNIPLLRTAVAKKPDRVFLRYDLGYRLCETGHFYEASPHLEEGLRLATLDTADEQTRVEGSLCAQVMCSIALAEDDFDSALQVAERGLAAFPDNIVLKYCKARCLLAFGKPSQAVELLAPLSNLDPDTFFDRRLAYSKSVISRDIPAALGAAEFKNGQFSRATASYAKALKFHPDSLEYKVKQALCLARAANQHS
jgi:glycosyltransferase involved in cell wall biosynthesis